MNPTVKYKGTYTDSLGPAEVTIENDFKTLHVDIDGVRFSGSEFSDLAIVDKANHPQKQLERFSFYPIPVYNTDTIQETLCNCSFEFSINQVLIDRRKNTDIDARLSVNYSLGKARPQPQSGIESEKVQLTLFINEWQFSGEGDFFEVAFDQIKAQLTDRYSFKNCYGCLYGDYSYIGQSSFGTMQCYVNQKEAYLKVNSKDDYMDLPADYRQVQEIYCCDKFEIRKPGTGYRG
ncbi:DUF6304 family protein [Chitinophaga tropicalis]|uniref:Uncharacterized protein n=1 Tax=Chitinophaga tropicalis TaxID=2683588 RepID=A0A7K1UAB5_9BACT|nr:DUF6304 family protein [Chitinophaga tropicalis]MVT11307.1 hypothetical protein [Chitinophaga tropicalis]